MSDSDKSMNRIPFESVEAEGAVSSWQIPTVQTKKSRLLFSAKKDKQKQKSPGESSEVVEDYQGAVKPKALTAEDLVKMAEEAKKEGFEQGYQEGLAKGTQEGQAKGLRQGEQKAYKDTHTRIINEANKLNEIASNLLQPMQEQENAMEHIIVDMAVHFALGLLQDEITQAPNKLLSLVRRAITSLPAGSKNISVAMSAADARILESYIPLTQRNWTIEIDNGLTSGGFRVETHESLVDYTVESRLKAFIETVREQGEVGEDKVAPVMEISEDQTDETQTEEKQAVEQQKIPGVEATSEPIPQVDSSENLSQAPESETANQAKLSQNEGGSDEPSDA